MSSEPDRNTQWDYSPGLSLCRDAATFMQQLFLFRVATASEITRMEPPASIEGAFLADLILAYRVFEEAASEANEFETTWTIQQYRDKGLGLDYEDTQEENLQFRTSNAAIAGRGKQTLRDQPCHIKDSEDRVWCWYLPGLINKQRQRVLSDALFRLNEKSEKGLQIGGNGDSNWRTNKLLYKNSGDSAMAKPGAVCYSPCWYEQGRGPSNRDSMAGPSQSLVNDPEALIFLQDTQEVAAILGSVLSIIHPELYERGMEVLEGIYRAPYDVRNVDLALDTLTVWASPFTALSVISNRSTPLHRDMLGGLNCFDTILTWGEYFNGRFEIPAAGMTFRYDPGTSIYLDTRTFRHGASTVIGDRYCFVLFFRPSMLQHSEGGEEDGLEEKPLPKFMDLVGLIRSRGPGKLMDVASAE